MTWRRTDNRLVKVTAGAGTNPRNVFDASGFASFAMARSTRSSVAPSSTNNNSSTGTKPVFAGAMRVASVSHHQREPNQATADKKGMHTSFHEKPPRPRGGHGGGCNRHERTNSRTALALDRLGAGGVARATALSAASRFRSRRAYDFGQRSTIRVALCSVFESALSM